MSQSILALRSGVSLPVVQRILSGNHPTASFANVQAIAEAIGMDLRSVPTTSQKDLRRQQARQKAKDLMGLVQGTMGLEGQAVSPQSLQRMEQQVAHELLIGSPRKLWG
jgi:ornithine carbamoyltransferase